MISWQSIMSVFNTKGTLLKWLKTLDQSLKDGVLESVTVNSVSEGVITLSFNFADGSVITTPEIDIPQGAQGPQGPQGEPGEQGPQGVPGPAGSDLFSDFSSLKIDTTDATVTYINGVATITNARLIGYKSGGNEEVEIAVDLPIKAGDNVTIDASEDDKNILISASGGGIEYAEQLPTASETSPNFVQTPDGTLYRKKAVESGGLLGTWVINSTNEGIATGTTYNIGFTSNGNSYTSMSGRTGFFPGDAGIRYNDSTVYTQTSGWTNENFRTINITDISSLTNVDEFNQWLTANATGGGASVSYEYVAMQEVPTPTTADNGKVLGVTNGAYALQEASGGGGTQLYLHFGEGPIDPSEKTYYLAIISTTQESYSENPLKLAEDFLQSKVIRFFICEKSFYDEQTAQGYSLPVNSFLPDSFLYTNVLNGRNVTISAAIASNIFNTETAIGFTAEKFKGSTALQYSGTDTVTPL